MFLGEYQHNLDDKGRLVMPRKFRHDLADGVVITKGHEKCVYAFTVEQWEIEVAETKELSRKDKGTRLYSRSFFGSAADVELDKQGRIPIPTALRDFAGLDKDVTVVGVAERIEIWDAATWAVESAANDRFYAQMDEAPTEEGI